MNELDKIIQNRRSVRKFLSKKPDWRDIILAIDSVRYAPMSGNNFSLRIILVSDKEKIEKLAEASEQQFISTASYIVVFCTDSSKTTNLYEEMGETYLRQQAGAAIENFLLKLEELKLSTCWIGYFYEPTIKEILGIPNNIKVEAMFPIGYDGESKKTRKTKIELDRIIYFDKYKNKKMKSNREKNISV